MDIGLLTLGDLVADPVTGAARTPAQRHRTIVEESVVAERCGFRSVHLGEHHFLDYVLSSPAVVLAAIAERTSTLRLSTGVTLAANLDPIRVAEDYATVDVLSGGRVEPCFGRGTFFPYVFSAFGQDESDSTDRFAESVELIHRIWNTNGPVDFDGAFRAPLRAAQVQPLPTRPPRLWIGGGVSNDSVDLAARLGCGIMLPTVFGNWAMFRPAVERYIGQWERNGHDPRDRRIGACSHFFVGRDSTATKRRWLPRYQAYLDAVARWQQQSFTQAAKPLPRTPFHDATAMLDAVAICGSPSEVADRMNTIREALSLDTHILKLDLGGVPDCELFDAIELAGSDVLPLFADHRRSTP